MLKRFILLGTLVAALLALAAPAAQATGPLITNFLGQAAEEITLTSENTKMVTPLGAFECQTNNQQIDITSNAETTALGHGTGMINGNPELGEHTGGCGTVYGPYWHIDINSFHLTSHYGGTFGEVDADYTLQAKSGSSLFTLCSYSSSATAIRTGESTLHVNGKLTIKPGQNAACYRVVTFTSDFTVRDELGVLATIY